MERVYQIPNKIDPAIFTAKWNDKGATRPLIYHLLDSAATACLLWQQNLTEGTRLDIAKWLKLPVDEAGRLVAFWTALHDLGKATPTFQRMHPPSQANLARQGFPFPEITPIQTRHHSLLSAWILDEVKEELGIYPLKAMNHLRIAIGGHHGSYPSYADLNEETYKRVNLGEGIWVEQRHKLFGMLQNLLQPPPKVELALSGMEYNAFFNILSGFFVVADWISSQEEYFSYQQPPQTPDNYWPQALETARAALVQSGWCGWLPDGSTTTFKQSFSFDPHPLQQAILEYTAALQDPFLMIVEAPTGSGKTEAALLAADYHIQHSLLRGLYIAMPTQATSNQMFERVKKFLAGRFPDQNINFHLVHGNALLNKEFKEMQLSGIADEGDLIAGSVNALSWFIPRKRTLLAPFGVGTVDQTFFSVLQTKHFFLRLFGLHRKVIIFDEVHAYDVYMVELFKRLLGWLRAIGSSVIILSATLPENTRQDLLTAFDSEAAIESIKVEFPRLSINNRLTVCAYSLGTVENRIIQLEKIDRQPETIARFLKKNLVNSGCAAVICNTVARAQKVYQTLQSCGDFDPQELFLLHSRMPFCRREQCEGEIRKRFGKLGEPSILPRRGIVVATQVIEQSLDLDFDLMITDLAPVDLVIQRIGRLQRHVGSQYPPCRPENLSEAICALCMPEEGENGLAHFAEDRIYDEYILQRTFFTLRQYESLSLPADSDRLIEAVYSNSPVPECSELQNMQLDHLYEKMQKEKHDQVKTAENRMIGDVVYSSVLGHGQIALAEDDPEVHRDLQALTRDTHPGAQLVCLVKDENGTLRLVDGGAPFDLETPPKGEVLVRTLRSMVTISNAIVYDHFRRQPVPEAWKKVPQLRYAHQLIFENHICPLTGPIFLQLYPDLGIVIERKG